MHADRSAARKAAEESLRASEKIVNRWIVYPHRVPKSEIVGTLILLRDATRALLAEQPEAGAPLDLASLPVHFIAHLPRGRVFMHPDTPKGGVRDPWPPPMPAIKDYLRTAPCLDGDGRDGNNGSGPFEG